MTVQPAHAQYPGSGGGSNTGSSGNTGYSDGTDGTNTDHPGINTGDAGTGTSGTNNTGNTGGTGTSNTGTTGGNNTGSSTGYPGGGTGGTTTTPGHWDVSYSSQGTSSWDYQTDDSAVHSGSLPWSPTDSSASVGSNSYLDAATTGTISATLTWVPTTGQDSTSDPPASSVIVTETGYAAASGGGVGTASADDGWGDTSGGGEYPGDASGGGGYPGASSSASSSGTHYEVKDGSSGIITVSPFSLSAATPDNTTPDANGNFSMVGAFASVGLAVAGASNTITFDGINTAYQALTGQQVTAHFNGTPPNVSSYTWSFPSGTPIKTWDPNGKATDGITLQQLFPLTNTDTTGTDTTGTGIAVAALGFYDQTAEKVTVKCVVNYMLPKDKKGNAKSGTLTATSKPITFLKPTVTRWDIKGGWVQHYNSTNWGLAVDPNSTTADGMTWSNVTISVPTPFPAGGQGCFAQTITPDHEVFQDGVPDPIVGPNNKKAGLDSGFPYGPPAGFWTVPAPGGDSDGPGIVFRGGQGYNKLYANDTFNTWVMYKPPSNGQGSPIWVPLKTYKWGFSCTILWQNNGWVTTQAFPQDASSVPNFTPVDATDPPKWSLIQSNY